MKHGEHLQQNGTQKKSRRRLSLDIQLEDLKQQHGNDEDVASNSCDLSSDYLTDDKKQAKYTELNRT